MASELGLLQSDSTRPVCRRSARGRRTCGTPRTSRKYFTTDQFWESSSLTSCLMAHEYRKVNPFFTTSHASFLRKSFYWRRPRYSHVEPQVLAAKALGYRI